MTVSPPKKAPGKKQPVKRVMTTSLKQGLRTPNKAFKLPILQAVVQLGGSGRVDEVLGRVETLMKDQLNNYDYQPMPSDLRIIRWRNNAAWARFDLVHEGYLASDSPRGVWEITEAGRTLVLQANEGQS